MRLPSRIVFVALVGFGVLALAEGTARATIVPPQTRTVPLTDTNWSFPNPEPNNPFQKWDPANGALQNVVISISYNVSAQIDMTFKTNSATTITEDLTGTLVLNRPNNGTPLFTFSPLFTDHQSATRSSPQTVSFNNNYTGAQTAVLTSPSDLALFTGPGPLSLPIAATAQGSFTTSSGNGFASTVTMVGAVVTIQFNVVPELPSFSLLAMGGVGLLLLRPFRLFGRRSAPCPADV